MRLLNQAVDCFRRGGVVVYPTDSAYALGCRLGEKTAQARIRRLRQLSSNHLFTLVCRDLSQLGLYARLETSQYRLIKAHTPGPYTFILNATREAPRMLVHAKRRTVGVRVTAQPVAMALLTLLGEPILSVSLILPGETTPLTDPADINQRLGPQVDLVIDGGAGKAQVSTVIDLVQVVPNIVRRGCGDPIPFEVNR